MTPIYHITHVDNLPSIVKHRCLWSDAQRIAQKIGNVNIGHSHIKQRRLTRAVRVAAKGFLGDYVPFNFCNRSVMLCAHYYGSVEGYSDGQPPIVHLVSSVEAAIATGRPWAFTDRHADLGYARFFTNWAKRNEVDWEAMRSNGGKRKKRKGKPSSWFTTGSPGLAWKRSACITTRLRSEPERRLPRRNISRPSSSSRPGIISIERRARIMIEFGKGNLLDADVQALVNTVNTVGIMGKGIALQFKKAYPENFAAYAKACKRDEVQIGRMFIHHLARLENPQFIINFPTKGHWKGRSKLEDIEAGLQSLVKDVKRLNIISLALPPLGCGHGGLVWEDVYPMIVKAFNALPAVRVVVYAPGATPVAEAMPNRTDRPNMTIGRATILGLMQTYSRPGYDSVTVLEIQKAGLFPAMRRGNAQVHFRGRTVRPLC